MPDREFRFPEAFLEIGKDDDHSYNSLRTTRLSDGRLKIDVERWGIIEYGLCLMVNTNTNRVMELFIMGYCGSVFSETWIKASYSHIVEKEEEDKAQQIEFRGGAPAEAGDIDVRLRLRKSAYPKS